MGMNKMQLKAYRDRIIVGQYTQGLQVEDLAYIFNISSERVQEILRNSGISAKIDTKRAAEMKSSKVKRAVTTRGW